MKRLELICASCLIGLGLFISASAQDVPKTLSGGVLNGKATALPKPAFPAAARAVGASGAVAVQVLIDENGEVVSANAVSGHPLLRAAAVEAARGARFSPTTLQGIPVKVSGIITYNFVGALQIARLAFVLSHAVLTSSFGAYSSPESLASQLPESWTAEKEILNSLTFEEAPKSTKPAEKMPEVSVAKPPPPDAARDKNRYTVIGSMSLSAAPSYGTRKLDSKSMGAVQNLLGLTEGRASVKESAAWAFELGKLLGVLVVEIDDQSRFQSNVNSLESLANRAPSGVVQYSRQQVIEFVEFCKQNSVREANKQDIISKAEMLSNLRY